MHTRPAAVANSYRAISLCNVIGDRCARRSTGKCSVDKLPILYHGHAIDEHKFNPFGILERLFKRSLVDDALLIKDGDVRVGTHADASLIVKHRRALLEPLR